MLHYFLGNFTPETRGFPVSIWIGCFLRFAARLSSWNFLHHLSRKFFSLSPVLDSLIFLGPLPSFLVYSSLYPLIVLWEWIPQKHTFWNPACLQITLFMFYWQLDWLEYSIYKITFFQNLEEIVLLSSSFLLAFLIFVFVLLYVVIYLNDMFNIYTWVVLVVVL